MESKYKVHCFYILLILISIIIGLISVEWSQVPGLVDYITFALTLSSLILAGLAIVYSIYSNTSMSNSLNQISSAASDVTKASVELKSSNVELKAEVEKLPSRLDNVDKNISDTHRALINLSESQELFVRSDTTVAPSVQSEAISEELALNFVNQSSVRGLELLYMVVLSYETKTSFSIDEVIETMDGYEGENNYLLAYKIAANAIGLCSSTYDAQLRESWLYVHPVLLSNVERVLKEKSIEIATSGLGPKLSEAEKTKKKIARLNEINKIAQYFGKSIEVA